MHVGSGMTARSGQLRSFLIVGLALLTLTVGCSREAPPSPGDLPPPCELLPIISTSPLVLHDTRETRDYLNAFPVSAYRKYGVPDAGHFFIDDVEDSIKAVIVAGLQWEARNVEMLEKHVEPNSVVVEVGAHIGSHTVLIARMVGPCGRVYAFEPQRKLYRELHRNLALNGITNVVPLKFAVGAGDARIIEMNLPPPGNEGRYGDRRRWRRGGTPKPRWFWVRARISTQDRCRGPRRRSPRRRRGYDSTQSSGNPDRDPGRRSPRVGIA